MGQFWQRVISARVESYIAMLRRHGAQVYWVGLPVMHDPAFDADARAMDEFYRGLMARLDVPYIDIRPITADAQGQYQAYYLDKDGTPKLFRAGDGVHMSMNGYIRITLGLAGRIRASVAAARGGREIERSVSKPEPPAPIASIGTRAPAGARNPIAPRRPLRPHVDTGVVADVIANIGKGTSKPNADTNQDEEQ
jgi:uncharacterized protein